MAYLLQIACVTLVAEALLRLIPVSSAGFRYAYWRLVLVTALLAPWLFRGAPGVAESDGDGAVPLVLASARFVQFSDVVVAEGGASWITFVPWVLAAGVAARVLWVVAGMTRLRRLRRTGLPVADDVYDEIQHRLGTRAELRTVPGLPQPVTFGVRRPVVLLPGTLPESPDAIRRAVVTHELVHVRRRDWISVLVEEALRAGFWFHPAIWWLTARVQLTREEFTDHLAVLATGSRRQYMEALLAFAEAGRLEPAPAFARRAHLFHRIVLLSKEPAMSSRRIVLSGAALSALVVTGAWYASEAFPLHGSLAPTLAAAQAANPVTPENPIPRRVVGTPVPYPPELAGTGFRGAVEVQVVLNAAGSVQSAVAVSVVESHPGQVTVAERRRAKDAFAAAAVDGVRRWHYDPPFNAPVEFYAIVTFSPGAVSAGTQSGSPRGVSADFVPAFNAIGADAAASATPSAIRVGGAIKAPTRTRQVAPIYPAVAQDAKVQGVVILEITVDENGRVTNPRVLRSIPLLDQAAIDAVSQWEYTPTLFNGVPVPVIMTVTVQFTLT